MTDGALAVPSRRLLAAAEAYFRRYAARHFGSLRVACDGRAPAIDAPTVFYSNHPSWWDPIVMLLLIRTHYPDWRFHGPIDAAALARYPWLERIGLFGIEPGTPQGMRRFLDAGGDLLGQARSGLAMTAQGAFTDVRARPVELKRGLAALLKRNPDARAIPIAIEYVFWNERLPEVLVRFGRDSIGSPQASAASLHDKLERSLEHEMNLLEQAARAREPDRFDCLLTGRRGIGFFQDLPLRVRSMLRGKRFDPSHAAIRRGPG